jgi:hypothetical protein
MNDYVKGILAYIIYVPIAILLILIPLGFIFGLIGTLIEIFFEESVRGTILRLSALGIVASYFYLIYYIKRHRRKGFGMKLLKVEMPKAKLSLIPKEERVFFIKIGNLLNDLSLLHKLTIFSTNVNSTNNIVSIAQNMQTLSLIRIQAGILNEGWQLLNKSFFVPKLSEEYHKQLSDSERQSLEKLKSYFGKENLIYLIRNNFAFHYYSKPEQINQLNKLIDDVEDSETFEIYLTEYYANCVFSMSNVLITTLILNNTTIDDTDKAFENLLGDIVKVTSWFGDFLGGCLRVFAAKYPGFESYEVQIPNPIDINDVALPYFIKGEIR